MQRSIRFAAVAVLSFLFTSFAAAQTTVLTETFNGCTVGSHATPSGTDIGTTLDAKLSTTGWTGSKVYEAGGEIKLGTSSLIGYIVTKTVDLSAQGGVATVKFIAEAWAGDTPIIQIFHAPDGTTFTQVGSDITTVTTTAYSTVSVQITNGTASSKIKISAKAGTKQRFYLDSLYIQQAALPTLTTAGATDITAATATLGGTVSSDGGSAVTARGVCYGVAANPTTADSHTSDGTGTGTFTSSLSGLSGGTTYHIRAYATNAAGTAYGNDTTFTTLSSGSPTIILSGSVNFGNVVVNSTSSEMTYTISGTNLSPSTDNISLTAPTGFLISTTSGSGYSTGIAIGYAGGELASTTVYVIFQPTDVQEYSGTIYHTGGGADMKTMAVSGTGVNASAPTALSVGYITSTKMQVTWTKPSGTHGVAWDGVVVFARDNASVDASVGSLDGAACTDGGNVMGLGAASGNSFVVANSTADANGDVIVDMSVLAVNDSVHFTAYAYKTITGSNNDQWSSATSAVVKQLEVQGVTGFAANGINTKAALSWTNYTGAQGTWWDEVVILAKAGSAVDGVPTGDGSALTAGVAFGTGTEVGSGNYVVYKGTGTKDTVSGLTNSTTYHFRAYVRYGTVWTDAGQYKEASATPMGELTANDVMISHYSARLKSASDEMMVLFNNTNAAVDLNGYEIAYSSATGSAASAKISWTTSTVIPARKYRLLATTATVTVGTVSKAADQTYTSFAADAGQTALRKTSNGTVIYALATGTITTYSFGNTSGTATTTSSSAPGMFRLTASGNTYTRTGNNSTDYTLVDTASISSIPNSTDAPLPVELVAFTVTAERLNATLMWKTATETQNLGFEIERRTVGGNAWSTIGFVAGMGTSSEGHQYVYIDAGVPAGRYAYRIKQIDKDGAFAYHNAAEVEIGTAPKTLTLSRNYPNPFNPETHIEFAVPDNGRAVLKVYNMLGQEVATLYDGYAVAGHLLRANFRPANLTSGIYFARLRFGSESLMRQMVYMK